MINIEKYIKTGLSPNAYFILQAMILKDSELSDYIETIIDKFNYMQALEELESNQYIKIQGNNLVSRQKLLTLQNKISPEIDFDKFWDNYHEITGQKKTDLQASLKYWNKLSKHEKKLALNNISDYYSSLPMYSTGKPVKKARTYLNEKNFNDEFEVKTKSRVVGL